MGTGLGLAIGRGVATGKEAAGCSLKVDMAEAQWLQLLHDLRRIITHHQGATARRVGEGREKLPDLWHHCTVRVLAVLERTVSILDVTGTVKADRDVNSVGDHEIEYAVVE